MNKNKTGHYGIYGGRYVAETLMPALLELESAFHKYWDKNEFRMEFNDLLRDFVGRPTPLFFADNLTRKCGGAKIFLKREDLAHTGAHKINNTIGQALLAKYMKKPRLIAETGAGMHGVATATAAALFNMQCDVFMGKEDIRRQEPNVDRMKLMGANVIPVSTGSATLKDAMNEALRDWVATVNDTFYVIGTVAGPAPYPEMVREFQHIIGTETRRQILKHTKQLPTEIIACVGGGSNAMGIFSEFLDDKVTLTGVEAGGSGLESGKHAASISGGTVGVLHGNKTYLLQNQYGQITPTHSISAGLDYPGVGPQHAHYHDAGRIDYCTINDDEAVTAFQELCRLEGIIPALESAHAVAQALKKASSLKKSDIIVINLSGRGDKDMASVKEYLGEV